MFEFNIHDGGKTWVLFHCGCIVREALLSTQDKQQLDGDLCFEHFAEYQGIVAAMMNAGDFIRTWLKNRDSK